MQIIMKTMAGGAAVELIAYLQNVFSPDIRSCQISLPLNVPNYLRTGYQIIRVAWDDDECLIATPLDGINLQSMKKHVQQLQQLTGTPTALNMPFLTALQRNNLIQSKTPFICAGKQVYFPFWGSIFVEKYEKKEEQRAFFTPSAQAVFLYLVYHPNQMLTLSQIADELNISNTSLSRAVRELGELVIIQKKGQAKMISASENMLIRGNKYLKSPVEKKIYVRSKPDIRMLGGIVALSKVSMLAANDRDGAYVISRKKHKELPADVISAEEYRDIGGYELELWHYDPLERFDQPGIVDDISLLLTLSDDEDERVQIALDEIRGKYGLEADSEW